MTMLIVGLVALIVGVYIGARIATEKKHGNKSKYIR